MSRFHPETQGHHEVRGQRWIEGEEEWKSGVERVSSEVIATQILLCMKCQDHSVDSDPAGLRVLRSVLRQNHGEGKDFQGDAF